MIEIEKIDFQKMNGLIPAIVIDKHTLQVLMLGFMNKEALSKTIETGKVTFFSRTQNKLWTKGETSGNLLDLYSIQSDCDYDTLLIEAIPSGNTCHTGKYSCFDLKKNNVQFLSELFEIISKRKIEMPSNSYTTSLFQDGSDRIIQKVGEESVEILIAAKNKSREEIINEVSDLIYHLFVMLVDQDINLNEVMDTLESRHHK
ncbi:MAG: bifunctional phosphoribosyl-AMP cyclohydrolase/phosphoribosyl-ATP diphosphatase HisIE [Melioribacteraceae bacterium]|nr:bifunctional phosphoribosyl-AMP cyclohydrolase/phosphoribosyl-ATP diphosphatase HisIE [Melioribacteraceae bacterium]